MKLEDPNAAAIFAEMGDEIFTLSGASVTYPFDKLHYRAVRLVNETTIELEIVGPEKPE